MFKSAEITMFPADTPVYGPRSVQRSDVNVDPITGSETFVRIARMYLPRSLRHRSLENILGGVDRKLEHVANLCDAEVVEHQWGLIPYDGPPDPSLYSSQAPPIPPSHRLVSKVQYIVPYERPVESYERVHAITRKYDKGGIFGSRRLGDMSTDDNQFTFGIPGGRARVPSLFLTDVEPVYRGFEEAEVFVQNTNKVSG